MKKTLITAIVLQCLNLYGMETIPTRSEQQIQSSVTALVTANYFDDEIRRFNQDIASEITRVNSRETTVDQAIVSITVNCRTWFESCRAQINERYMTLIISQQRQQQLETQVITAAKDQEIRVLQERLDTLLSTHTGELEGLRTQLRIFDQQRIEAEQRTRTARERVDSSSAAELVTESQLRRTMDRLTRDLGTIRTEIQDGTRTLEDAFARAEEKYSDSIETLLRSLEDRYADVLSGVAERSAERISHLTEAYERQIELIRRMLDEAISATRVAEEKRALVTQIGHICSSNHLNPATSIISQRSLDISVMDVFKRRSILLEIYEKRLQPFKELLTSEDLDQINVYLIGIRIGAPLPKHPDTIVGPMPDLSWGWTNYGRGGPHDAWINGGETAANWIRYWSGGMTVYARWWNKWGANSDGAIANKSATPIATGRYNAAVMKYVTEKAAYDSEVRRATSIVFPSSIFDSLVSKVNEFFKQLI